MTARQAVAAAMSERELVDNIIDRARWLGYRACHFRPARMKDGEDRDRWVTPIQGDKGWPDIVIAGKGRFLVVEAKSEKGDLEPDQRLWIAALELAGVDVRIWRPSDWLGGVVDEVLG